MKKLSFRYLSATIILCAVLGISACTPVTMAAGAGASVGVAAMQEGGISEAASDATIKIKISNLWVKSNFDIFRKLDLTVKEGRVLITGTVPNADMRVEAVRLAWKVNGVKQVLNEITVDNERGIGGMMQDAVISTTIRTKLMFDKHINSINYNIDTSKGNVYVMGIAKNQAELDLVLDYARNTNDVENVINYARLSSEKIVEEAKN